MRPVVQQQENKLTGQPICLSILCLCRCKIIGILELQKEVKEQERKLTIQPICLSLLCLCRCKIIGILELQKELKEQENQLTGKHQLIFKI